MARDLTIEPNVLDRDAREDLERLIAAPIPAILRNVLEAARDADDGLTSSPQHRLYAVLESLHGWRAEPMPALQERVRALYASAMRHAGRQTVHTCLVREMLGLASHVADGGKAERIGYRIGTMSVSLSELRQGPLLARGTERVAKAA